MILIQCAPDIFFEILKEPTVKYMTQKAGIHHVQFVYFVRSNLSVHSRHLTVKHIGTAPEKHAITGKLDDTCCFHLDLYTQSMGLLGPVYLRTFMFFRVSTVFSYHLAFPSLLDKH